MKVLLEKIHSENGINYLNVFLIVASSILAFIIPFHLFLFVYAFIGPLHYLTEISWLNERNFFITKKPDVLVLILIFVLIFLALFIPFAANFITPLIVFSLLFTFIILTVNNVIIKYILAFVLLIISIKYLRDDVLMRKDFLLPIILFSILLPTLIHVYVFTGIFLVGGAIKQKLLSGYISVFVFIICSIIFFILIPNNTDSVSSELKLMFDKFKMMNKTFMYIFGLENFSNPKDIWLQKDDAVYNSSMAYSVMRFIAFAYCYHYLNWFSKTSVIKWHQVSKKRIALITSLWIISVGLYLYDYSLGFYALFVLSMMHVLLEFPLNFLSIKNILKSIKIQS